MVRYASTFLSHESSQKPFVRQVKECLQRLGVIAWLDEDNLSVGVDLSASLRQATQAQTSVTVFLSERALASAWVKDELEPRLRTDQSGGDAIVPVYLGDPIELVKQSPLLRERWLTPDGKRVDRLGIVVRGGQEALAKTVAEQLAGDLFRRVGTHMASRVAIAVDQRGRGSAVGVPIDGLVPPNWSREDWPCLVFRPSKGPRTPSSTLHGEDWSESRIALETAVAIALGTHSRREIYVTGRGQLAFAWLIGTLFDRSTLTRLIVRNAMSGDLLDLDQSAQQYRVPAPYHDDLEAQWSPRPPDASDRAISIALMATRYLPSVHAFRDAIGDETPLAVRETGLISSIEDVLELHTWISNVVRKREVLLYSGLPFHVLVLLAALSKHVIGRVTFMEYDADASTYHACKV